LSEHLVICGNGACAAALLVALAKRNGPPLRVSVIGNGPLYRGVAYSTEHAFHLLNVPASRMSIDHNDKDHFLRWLSARGGVDPSAFLPRALYGTYLTETVQQSLQAAPHLKVETVRADLLGVTRRGEEWHVFHSLGVVAADAVVLATGTEAPAPLRNAFGDGIADFVTENPWGTWQIHPKARVLVLGTGLTAVDSVLSLLHADHQGKIVMVSRRGLLPLGHIRPAGGPQAPVCLPPGPLSHRLKALRAEIRRARHWQDVFDTLRSQWRTLWEQLPDEDRRRFLRHAVAHFNAHRHRMAPQVAMELDVARKRNLKIQRCRVIAMAADGTSLRVTVKRAGQESVLLFDAIINCTGPNYNSGASSRTFVQTLLAAGMLRSDPLGLGIDVGDDNQVLGHDGMAQRSLFAIGAPTRGRWWETTAIPEIRQQAACVADEIERLGRTQAEVARPRRESSSQSLAMG
jgi:uncharacterized NAD(P)/FAD-binding protein YdhS